jgi:gliding motility-associated-like protein
MAATDNCSSMGDFVFSHQTPVGTVFSPGVNEVFMIAEDESGNTGTCSFTINVQDNTAPDITTCVLDQTLPVQANCEGALGDYTSLLIVSDACDLLADLVITQNPAPGTLVTSDVSVTITVEDLSGNSSQCTFNVLVEDQEDPIINCPTDSVIAINAACEYAAPDLTTVVTGLDNCSAFIDMTIVQSPAAGTTLSGADQIEVTLTDENGNSTSCFVATIPDDVIAPVITCPTDQIVNNGSVCDYILPDYTGSAAVVEACPGFSIQQVPAVGDIVSAGSHLIEIIVIDAGGNESSCAFNLDVIENVSPSITCPTNISQCDPIVTYAAPIASDNCVGFTLEQIDISGFTSGDTFPVGLTVQTYEVTDSSGNATSCSFTIEILESPDVAEIFTTTTSLCDTTSVVLNANSPTSGTGEWTVLTGGGSLNNQFSNTTGANNLDFGVNQFVWEISSALCGSTSDTLTIEVFELPFPASIPNDTLLNCYESLVNVTGNSPNVGQGNWYSPNPVSFVNSSQPNTGVTNLSDGWNDIIWEISNGSCPVTTDTVRIFSTPRATIQNNDTTLCVENNSLQLNGTMPFTGMQSLWYLIQGTANIVSETSANTEINSISAGENIVVHALTHPVCANTYDTLIVTVESCAEYDPVIPTVFTPNNDGKNDLFIIDNLYFLYPDCEVKIVNRWGNLVFESIGYLDPWDGTLLDSGELLPTGTYFYRVYLNDDAMTEITGSISIVR